ncbi:uncharacterized protein KD926_002753 [Aspergillus affinis]|uniref:uncharacterized protein n=1 Tax=Aspergillus affinis TaxID=1070780 RepID=UPI0022FE39F0|nr:uncharacterized protein KD926_002753 [Aspergillus affinis]KAI9043862.1 hypothetical protein KD926_002753 [Aspergillus affinis]
MSILRLYDIATRPPVEKSCCSPNPWKARLALNFKGLAYSTSWVGLPDIAQVRSTLKVPPCRKFADGTDFFTLPIVEDPATDSRVGDSFDIAVYLQTTYPNSGAGDLFPPQTLDYDFAHDSALLIPLSDCDQSRFPEYARFNMNVDAAFTAHVQLALQDFPFDPATAELTKAEFVRRAGVTCWEDFTLAGADRDKVKDSFRNMLGGLARLFGRDPTGPFLLGARASYADLIVGAWLRMMHASLPASEWHENHDNPVYHEQYRMGSFYWDEYGRYLWNRTRRFNGSLTKHPDGYWRERPNHYTYFIFDVPVPSDRYFRRVDRAVDETIAQLQAGQWAIADDRVRRRSNTVRLGPAIANASGPSSVWALSKVSMARMSSQDPCQKRPWEL